MDFKETVAEYLELIDGQLSEDEIPLHQRTLRASFMFVEHFVTDVDGDDKSNFESKPWFASIYRHVKEWYRDRYGPILEANKSGFASGVVLVRGVPTEVAVPLTRSEVVTPGEAKWLHFPITIDDEENPESWLNNPPPLDKLNKGERKKLMSDLENVGIGLRCIRINLMSIKPKDEIVDNLLSGVLSSFEDAAVGIVRNETSGRGAALWSLQMAIEKILKAYSQHKTGTFHYGHNLFSLYDDVKIHGISAKRTLLNKLPREQQIMSYRYGLGGNVSTADLFDAYNAAILFANQASRSFERDLSLGGLKILLKKPVWLNLQTDEKRSPISEP